MRNRQFLAGCLSPCWFSLGCEKVQGFSFFFLDGVSFLFYLGNSGERLGVSECLFHACGAGGGHNRDQGIPRAVHPVRQLVQAGWLGGAAGGSSTAGALKKKKWLEKAFISSGLAVCVRGVNSRRKRESNSIS
jgi:hypothetical protein